MTNDLVTPAELAGFPGAPFSDGVVDAAVANLRAHAGWHIAPQRTETLVLDVDGGTRVVLPSLRVTEVSAVRNAMNDPASEISDFRWSKSGVLSGCWWPTGFQSLEVDLTHGYQTAPPELLAAIAAEAQSVAISRLVASQAAGPFSQSFRDASAAGGVYATDEAVARYTLPSRP